jgi:SpoVK/Ycf46/Vps4 family AAA+-type ATPase
MDGYPDARAHVFDELHRLDLLLALRVAQARRDPSRAAFDQFHGLFLSEDEIDAILAPADRSAAALPSADEEAMRRIRAQEQQIAERTVGTPRSGAELPLVRLTRLFELAPFDVDALMICLAPELDPRYGTLYAYLQDDATRRCATNALVLATLCDTAEDRLRGRARLGPSAPLARYGLLVDGDPAPPRAPGFLGRSLRVDAGIVEYLLQLSSLDSELRRSVHVVVPPGEGLERARLTPAAKAFADAFLAEARALGQRRHSGVLRVALWGKPGAGKKFLAESLCGELRIPLLVADTPSLLTEPVPFAASLGRVLREGALRHRAVFLDRADAVIGDSESAVSARRQLLETAREYRGVLFVGSRTAPVDADDALVFEVADPDFAARRALWSSAIAGAGHEPLAAPDLDRLADTFPLTPGEVLRASSAAGRTALATRGTSSATFDELFAACRALGGAGLGALARRMVPVYGWHDIVLPAQEMRQLREICLHARHRQRVFGGWGFDRKFSLGKGLNVLFVGESGTGKTMAAEVMAADLKLELYKVDLSCVVSKYIGETERNLSAIFREADDSRNSAVLFFDEADALFGKRSEVKDAHDRYANIEINYLLQRLEEYSGVVILASNFRRNIDDAFIRRLRFVVEFPFPEEAFRERIWRGVFPADTPLAPSIDFGFLAARLKLTGGSIRNIVLHAAFLAADDGTAVGMDHVMRAVRREFQKTGRLCVRSDFGPYFDLVEGAA